MTSVHPEKSPVSKPPLISGQLPTHATPAPLNTPPWVAQVAGRVTMQSMQLMQHAPPGQGAGEHVAAVGDAALVPGGQGVATEQAPVRSSQQAMGCGQGFGLHEPPRKLPEHALWVESPHDPLVSQHAPAHGFGMQETPRKKPPGGHAPRSTKEQVEVSEQHAPRHGSGEQLVPIPARVAPGGQSAKAPTEQAPVASSQQSDRGQGSDAQATLMCGVEPARHPGAPRVHAPVAVSQHAMAQGFGVHVAKSPPPAAQLGTGTSVQAPLASQQA